MKSDTTGDHVNTGSTSKLLSAGNDIADQIINHSRSMISIINRNYVYEKVNDTFCREHQIVNESVVGRSLAEVWGTETFNEHIRGKLDRCFRGETVNYEASFSTPRLGKRYYEVIFRPLRTNDEGYTHLMAETFDISDLRLSRQEVLEREEELRKFETNLPIGFIRCDTDGNIVSANKAFLKIMECPADTDLKGYCLKNFYPVELLFNVHVEQLRSSHSKAFGRVFLKNWRGNEIPCRLSGFIDPGQSGSQTFIDFSFEDSSRELMLENKLLQAQKMETVGALAGGIAHDFNNILATISGYSEMLQDDLPRDSELSEKVTRIQGAVLKARSIINQILTFSRQVEQEKIPVIVSEVLKETIGFVGSSIPSNISIDDQITDNRSKVLADPTQLFRVFLNLMTNAVQAMEEKGGVLTILMSTVDGKSVQHELNKVIVADEYILLTFIDTGHGMEPALLERIFEPFFTTRAVGKGTGLGLSVTHGIITEMEGEILVESREDNGSTFYVYLPVCKTYRESIPEEGKRRKILFITGNKHESRILSIALESCGYDLIYLTDRMKLIQTLSTISQRPDLIIYMSDSEQVHPDEIMAVFNQLGIDTPCILITDSYGAEIEEKLLISGIIKQHLIKPVSLKEMRHAIRISLSQT